MLHKCIIVTKTKNCKITQILIRPTFTHTPTPPPPPHTHTHTPPPPPHTHPTPHTHPHTYTQNYWYILIFDDFVLNCFKIILETLQICSYRLWFLCKCGCSTYTTSIHLLFLVLSCYLGDVLMPCFICITTFYKTQMAPRHVFFSLIANYPLPSNIIHTHTHTHTHTAGEDKQFCA